MIRLMTVPLAILVVALYVVVLPIPLALLALTACLFDCDPADNLGAWLIRPVEWVDEQLWCSLSPQLYIVASVCCAVAELVALGVAIAWRFIP